MMGFFRKRQNDKGEAFTHCFSGLLRQRLCAIVFDCFTIRGAKYRATRSHAMTREKGSHAMTGEATEWQEREWNNFINFSVKNIFIKLKIVKPCDII